MGAGVSGQALLCHLRLLLTTSPLLACALDLRKLGIKSVLEDGDRLTASLAPSSRPVGLSLSLPPAQRPLVLLLWPGTAAASLPPCSLCSRWPKFPPGSVPGGPAESFCPPTNRKQSRSTHRGRSCPQLSHSLLWQWARWTGHFLGQGVSGALHLHPGEAPYHTVCPHTVLEPSEHHRFQHSAFLCPHSRTGVASHQPGTVPAPGPLPGYSGTHPIPQISGEDSSSSVHDLQPPNAPQCHVLRAPKSPHGITGQGCEAMWASTHQDGSRGATGSGWRGREQLTAALEGGHFPEKSPDGTWPTWGEERKLLPCWGWGGSSEGGVLVY